MTRNLTRSASSRIFRFSDEQYQTMSGYFTKYEQDGDGELNMKELGNLVKGVSGSEVDAEEKTKALMSKLDTSGNASLNFNEFLKGYERMLASAADGADAEVVKSLDILQITVPKPAPITPRGASSTNLKKQKEEAERKAKEEADKKAKEEADRKAKEEADKKAKEAAAKAEADKKAKDDADKKAKDDADKKAKDDADKKAKEAAAKAEADKKAKDDADKKAKEEADKKAKEAAAKAEADKKAKDDADRKAKEAADKKAKEEADRKAKDAAAAGPRTVSYVIRWPHGGNDVKVAGSWNNWEHVPMTHDGNGHYSRQVDGLEPETKYLVKFFVDGEWQANHDVEHHDHDEQVDGFNVHNNYFVTGN